MFPIRDKESSGIIPIVTVSIIILNAAVLVLQLRSPEPDLFTYRLALVPALINFANPVTLYPFITAMFLHAGILHFLVNMWFLRIFGDNVEAVLGGIGYFIFYLSGGIVATLIELFFMPGSTIPVLGASGAIAAVLGFYLIVFPRNTVTSILPLFPFIIPVNLPSVLFLGLWFLGQIVSGVLTAMDTSSAATGGIAWWAHIGGFVYGMVMAILYKVLK